MTEKRQCTVILQNGKNSGQECGKVVTEGNTMCAYHRRKCEKSQSEVGFCCVRMKGGKHKDMACGKKTTEGCNVCAYHNRQSKGKTPEMSRSSMPDVGCRVKITRGERKGQICGRKIVPDWGVCRAHGNIGYEDATQASGGLQRVKAAVDARIGELYATAISARVPKQGDKSHSREQLQCQENKAQVS